jgi:hypothetical protein
MSFMWDYQNLIAGGLPQPFAWKLFSAGELAGIAAFLHAFRLSRRTSLDGAPAVE